MGAFWLHDIDDILRQGVGRGIVELVEVHGDAAPDFARG